MTDSTAMPKSASDANLVIDSYAERSYLNYAIAVVKDRALALVQDGQKPVQLRILYAMNQLGLTPSAKPVKSARIVGDVLGKHHPHGDSAAYDAMVRMAQDFSLRYPLVQGQGNFGSRDGDSAAAMRYTEARLSPVAASLLLAELGQGTVDWVPNYDGTLKEPALLPARLPILLLNGCMGIAVGMASNIPPHNLAEVAGAAAEVLRNPEASLDDILRHIPGPDFPDGGQLVSSPEEIRAAYSGGRGSLRCRARWVREDLARGQWQLVINELPYQVSTRTILEELDALTNPKVPAGKKTISQQQAVLKQAALEMLEKASDESGKAHRIRLVLVPRSSKVDPEQLMTFLLANTSLESSVSVNCTLLGLDGSPGTRGLERILKEWSTFRVETVRRRTAWQLEGVRRRVHILEGRMIVFLNLDAVVRAIRDAEDPSSELMSAFSLTAEQAADILEMRLRQLNRLEGAKLEAELAELRTEAERLQNLMDDAPALRRLVIAEVEADAVRFGDARRTLIQPVARVASGAAAAVTRSAVDEPVTVVLSRNRLLKVWKGSDVSEDQMSFKTGDGLHLKVNGRTAWPLVLLDDRGRAYSIDTAQLPAGRGDGIPLSTVIDLQDDARVAHLVSGAPGARFLFCGQQGYGFQAPIEALLASRKAGKAFLTLESTERPMPPVLLPGEKEGLVLVGSSDGRLLAFNLEEVKSLSGGKGVMLMVLEPDQLLTGIAHRPAVESVQVVVSSQGQTQVVELDPATFRKHLGHRARKGAFLPGRAALQG